LTTVHFTYLTSSDFISTDVISSEPMRCDWSQLLWSDPVRRGCGQSRRRTRFRRNEFSEL